MFKVAALIAVVALGAVNAGVLRTHTIAEPTFAEVGGVVHNLPTSVSSQHFTRVQTEAEVNNILVPVVISSVRSSPVIQDVVVQQHLEATAPIVDGYAAASSAGIISGHTFVEPSYSKVAYNVPTAESHQSLTGLQNKADGTDIVVPLIRSVEDSHIIESLPVEHDGATGPVVETIIGPAKNAKAVLEPSFVNVGNVVHQIPTAVSHQTFTRVHNKAEVSETLVPVAVEARSVVEAPAAPVVAETYSSPTSEVIGEVLHKIPTAVSHQSLTRVHNKAEVTDIVVPLAIEAPSVVEVPAAPTVVEAYSAPTAEGINTVDPTFKKVGEVLHTVPTSVSQQSFTRFHNTAEVTDIIAPVVRTLHTAPIVRTVPHTKHVIEAATPVADSVDVVSADETYAAVVDKQSEYGTPAVVGYDK